MMQTISQCYAVCHSFYSQVKKVPLGTGTFFPNHRVMTFNQTQVKKIIFLNLNYIEVGFAYLRYVCIEKFQITALKSAVEVKKP